MPKPSEEISKYTSNSNGKTDANLANDSNHLGGVPANEFATKGYVQEYHTAKETELKQEINDSDENVLNRAKAYTDTVVGNQDFSTFAKLIDLQTLDNRLSGQIQACGINCDAKINSKIRELANDVNSNFQDVENSITSLNQTQQQLFTSVSNGKNQIAAAITDKGVNTASDATFQTMATNIRKIETGGGDYDENFVNTADATATAEDLMLGQTAYAKGQKLYGTHRDLDTSDATANAGDILMGASAYVNGQKIYGTYEAGTTFDTSDATALPSDIISGKSAYADGIKMIGTYVPLDTSDGTATASDITRGKVAYVNGQRILGTSVATEYPTYGTNTNNATALASDIAAGKTAYVGGQYVIGTFAGNSNVQEIYDSGVDGYDIQEGSCRYNQEGDTDRTVTSRRFYAFSKDNNYCVSQVRLDDGTYAIDSNMVTKDGLVVQASAGANNNLLYKKYRYTYEELGINSNEIIQDIVMGCPGAGGSNNRCLLVIQTYISGVYKFHVYTYHLEENGVIGRDSSNDSFVLNDVIDIESNLREGKMMGANTNPYTFFRSQYFNSSSSTYDSGVIRYYFAITLEEGGEAKATLITGNSGQFASNSSQNKTAHITFDDKYIIFANRNSSSSSSFATIGLAYLDENLGIKVCKSLSTSSSNYIDAVVEPTTNKLIVCYQGRTRTNTYGIEFEIYDITIGENSISLSNKQTKHAYFDQENSKGASGHMVLSSDGSKVIILAGNLYYNSSSYMYTISGKLGIATFNVSDILDTTAQSDVINPIQTEEYSFIPANISCTPADWHLLGSEIGEKVLALTSYNNYGTEQSSLVTMTAHSSGTNLKGIIYKGQYFKKE